MEGDASSYVVRRAARSDVAELAELMFQVPSKEAVALAGSAKAAKRFRAALLEHAIAAGTSTVIVLADDVAVVGFAEVTTGGDMPPVVTVARSAIRAMGLPGAIVAGIRSTARLRVDITAPAGGLHLAELQVDPVRRNRGLGARLLAEVEREARRIAVDHISLTTAIDNPARRLYDRSGYEVIEEKRDARYGRLTGSPGRVLMVKVLDGRNDRTESRPSIG